MCLWNMDASTGNSQKFMSYIFTLLQMQGVWCHKSVIIDSCTSKLTWCQREVITLKIIFIQLHMACFTVMAYMFNKDFTIRLDMCLWNTDAPSGNKVKIWQKSLKSYILTWTHPQGHGMTVKCEEPIDELPVQVWLLHHHPNFKYCTLFASGMELRTNNPITRCPRWTFQVGGITILSIWAMSRKKGP